jgi:hypothetical protein
MRLSLSKRKHLPVLYVDFKSFTTNFPIWHYKRAQILERALKASGLNLDYWGFAAFEEVTIKGDFYLPNFDLSGKTVLDAGACCGETAWFFLKNGAKKVICIEPDENRAKLIRENKQKLGLNIELYEEPFDPQKHLKLEFDFFKVDIEGFEELALPYAQKLGPCIAETHTIKLRKEFEKKGFQVIKENVKRSDKHEEISLVANYEFVKIPDKVWQKSLMN